MSNVYAIADLHFGHAKLATLRGFSSVQEHDQTLVANWNNVVTKRDVVYVLGDVFRLECVPLLNGTKKLAMGNHDKYPIERYVPLFSKIAACFEFDGCLLTHIPVHYNQFPRFARNIHGHMHAEAIQDNLRYICVSAERWGLAPVSLRSLTARVT